MKLLHIKCNNFIPAKKYSIEKSIIRKIQWSNSICCKLYSCQNKISISKKHLSFFRTICDEIIFKYNTKFLVDLFLSKVFLGSNIFDNFIALRPFTFLFSELYFHNGVFAVVIFVLYFLSVIQITTEPFFKSTI